MGTPRNENETYFGELCKNLSQQFDYATKFYNANNKEEVWCWRQLNDIDARMNSNASIPFKEQVSSMEAKLNSIINDPKFKQLPSPEKTDSKIIRNFIVQITATSDLMSQLHVDMIVEETEKETKSQKAESAPNLRSRAGAMRSQNPPSPVDPSKNTSAPDLRGKEAAQWRAVKNPATKSSVVMGRKNPSTDPTAPAEDPALPRKRRP